MFGWIISLLFFFLILAGIVLLIYWAVKQFAHGSTMSLPESKNAMEVLKQRYAKGEINKEEFERIKKDLM